MELLDEIMEMTYESLLERFQAELDSNYYTWYMRLLTAGKWLLSLEPGYP